MLEKKNLESLENKYEEQKKILNDIKNDTSNYINKGIKTIEDIYTLNKNQNEKLHRII